VESATPLSAQVTPLVALSPGLSNLAAAIGIGAGGVNQATRVRVGITFWLFEFGARIGQHAGERGQVIGGGIVVAVGITIGAGAFG
jgi:hypothetical protein